MKSWNFILAITVAVVTALAISAKLAAQDATAQAKTAQPHHYKLIDLGTFGGVASYINPVGNGGAYMNRRGMVVGSAMTSIPIPPDQNGFPCPSPPDQVFHAMQWSGDGVTDLGTLGDSSNCANALAINDGGESVGTSENGSVDPLTGVLQIRAVRWKNGEIENLGTFGGNHSIASSINNLGQIVGFALNTIPDSFSLFALFFGGPSSGTQTRAFLSENGHKRDLKTLGGPDANAVFINERGQVAGFSYTNSTPNATTGFPTVDPFLWDKGKMLDLGTLGGTVGVPTGINNRGQVIGQSNLAGDHNFDPFLWDGKALIDMFTGGIGGNFLFANSINDAGEVIGVAAFQGHPFDAAVWRSGVVTDLGALPGDCFSQASVMNSRGQIAGNSATCDLKTIRAALWDDGKVFDLNTLIPRNSSLLLVESNAINDRGEIAGNGFPEGCTDFSCTHAFVLIPCKGEHSNDGGCEDEGQGSTVTDQGNAELIPYGSSSAMKHGLTRTEIADRLRPRFSQYRGFGARQWKLSF